jgi:hypothetical protein
MLAHISELFRYPIKGLSCVPLASVTLQSGRGVPGDRAFALALPSNRFDEANPVVKRKTEFLMLARQGALALRFKGERLTRRCPATEVNPETALRDINVPQELMRAYGHVHLGALSPVPAPFAQATAPFRGAGASRRRSPSRLTMDLP